MRIPLALSILISVTSSSAVQAQVDYSARLGLTYSTELLKDQIASDNIEVRSRLAPSLILGAALPIAPLYRAGLEVGLTSSGYQSVEGGTDSDLGTLRTGSITLGLDGPVAPNLRWRAGVGLLTYWPSEKQGIFLRGGTRRFLAGAGMDYRHPVTTRWALMGALRYDFHRFTTDELRARGFGQSQGVHRVSVSLGLARGGR